MPIALPRLVVPPPSDAPPNALAETLLELDHASAPAWRCDRIVPVEGGWAVGRRHGLGSIWRIAGPSALPALSHPAWLWTDSGWFAAGEDEREQRPVPATMPLRTLLATLDPISGARRKTIKTLAATATYLIRGQGPVGLAVPESTLLEGTAAHLALALLTLLPHELALQARIAIGDQDAESFDLVLHPQPTGCQHVVRFEEPHSLTDELCYFLRQRMQLDQPEQLEQLALTHAAQDAWEAAVHAAILAEPLAGVEHRLKGQPEAAVRALAARLQAGEEITEAVASLLAKVTIATRDPRPWRAIANRGEDERYDALAQTLAELPDSGWSPGPHLVAALCAVAPTPADPGSWLQILLEWLHAGQAPEAVASAIQRVLVEADVDRPTRASIWSELVTGLVQQGLDDEAMKALASPLVDRFVAEGAGVVIATTWTTIPRSFRRPAPLRRLVSRMAELPDGGYAIATLLQHLREHPEEQAVVVEAWAPTTSIGRRVAAVATEGDPLWLDVESALVHAVGADARAHFLMINSLPQGFAALNPVAVRRARTALKHAEWPDPEVAEVAMSLAQWGNGSGVWSWLAITSAPPGSFDDETIDATVVDFCSNTPESADARQLALLAARALGAAQSWEPLDHARWLVLLSLTPDDGSRLNVDLGVAVMQGLAERDDALERLQSIASELFELPGEHPATLSFVHWLVPRAWPSGLPDLWVDALLPKVPARLVGAWKSLRQRADG